VNTTVAGKLLADLGIAYNFSDSGVDSMEDDASIEAGMGDDTFTAALTVDFVQRFNFSATEGGAITFRSPHTSAEGYASMLVFDEAGAVMSCVSSLVSQAFTMSKFYITTTGASTILAESIFYNVKVRRSTFVLVCAKSLTLSLAATSNRPLTTLTSGGAARFCSVPRPAGTGVGRLARPARRCGLLAFGRSCSLVQPTWTGPSTGQSEPRVQLYALATLH
jgi:hypothetical protein